MNRVKKIIPIIIILSIVIQPNIGFASRSQSPPTEVKVEAINEDQPAIGYNEYDRHYVDFAWDVNFPGDATGGFVHFYTRKMAKSYRPEGARTLKEGNIPVSTSFLLTIVTSLGTGGLLVSSSSL
jgi:hypothetical protein